MQLKQYPEATEAFEDLVGIYPDVIDFRLALGKSYLKLPNYSAASELYTKIRTDYPTNPAGWFENGVLQMTMRNLITYCIPIRCCHDIRRRQQTRQGKCLAAAHQ